uniref:Putative ficolin n=1 Tax=Culex tarsalis TaxID=7177 RepID=A0A1Q3EUR9_CULTA
MHRPQLNVLLLLPPFLVVVVTFATEDKPSSTSCGSFGYELVATRLDSLENAAIKSHLKSLESSQSLRADIQQLTGSIQSLMMAGSAGGFHPQGSKQELPRSCSDVPSKTSGPILLDVSRGIRDPFEVYCEQQFENGGWLVFQNRFDGSVDFYRSWDEYRHGFGSLDGEFWLGLEKLHQITYSAPHELAIVLEDFAGEVAIARYSSFAVGGEAEQYSLAKLGTFRGSANDSLSYHKNARFSTFDRDNDEHSTNCAAEYIGAWWFRACHHSNLNSKYLPGGLGAVANRFIVWRLWKGDLHALKKTRMMIRRTAVAGK